MATSKLYDAIIIGGGPAGLSIAVSLSRQLYTALVLDSGVYRNAPAKHMHTVPGFDHADPADFRAKVKSDLKARYPSIEFKQASVSQVRKNEDGGVFEAVDGKTGEVYRGRKLGLATGVRDMLEKEPEGYADCWGKTIFHCLFCHGFEERGVDSVGVLAGGIMANAQMVGHLSEMAGRLAKHVTIYTNGNTALQTEMEPMIKSSKISFDSRSITKFRNLHTNTENSNSTSADNYQPPSPGVEITFSDGTSKKEGWVASHPLVEQNGPFAEQLGLELGPMAEIKVNPPFNETSVSGCFAVGDAATMMRSVMQATHMGGFAGTGMCFQLQHELAEKDEL